MHMYLQIYICAQWTTRTMNGTRLHVFDLQSLTNDGVGLTTEPCELITRSWQTVTECG